MTGIETKEDEASGLSRQGRKRTAEQIAIERRLGYAATHVSLLLPYQRQMLAPILRKFSAAGGDYCPGKEECRRLETAEKRIRLHLDRLTFARLTGMEGRIRERLKEQAAHPITKERLGEGYWKRAADLHKALVRETLDRDGLYELGFLCTVAGHSVDADNPGPAISPKIANRVESPAEPDA